MKSVMNWLEKLAAIVAIYYLYMWAETFLHYRFIQFSKSLIKEVIRAESSLKIERQSLTNMTNTKHQKASS